MADVLSLDGVKALTLTDLARFYYDVITPEFVWGKRLRWVLSERTVRHISSLSPDPIPDGAPIWSDWHLLGHPGRIDDTVEGLSYEWLER